MSRPPNSIGINPQMVLYATILAGCCGVAYYAEKHRDPDQSYKALEEHDYLDHSRESQIRHMRMAATVRGKDFRVEDRMNGIVWGGRAKQEEKEEKDDVKFNRYSNKAVRLGLDGAEAAAEFAEADPKLLENTLEEPEDAPEPVVTKKRRRRRRKVVAADKQIEETEAELAAKLEAANEKLLSERQRITLLAVGVVAAAAVSVFSNRRS